MLSASAIGNEIITPLYSNANFVLTLELIIGILIFIAYVKAIFDYFYNKMYLNTCLPILLIFYSLLLTVLIGISRLGSWPPEYGLQPRYVLDTSLGLIGVTWIHIYNIISIQNLTTKQFSYIAIAFIIVCQITSYYVEWEMIGPHRKIFLQNLQKMSITLAHNPDAYSDDELKVFHGSSPITVRKDIEILNKYKLNVFNDTYKTDEYLLQELKESNCFKVSQNIQISNTECKIDTILTNGWNQLENWGVWSQANAEMQIDLPKECQDKIGCDLVLNLATGVFNSTNEKPKTVYINVENKLIGKWSGELKAINILLSTELLNGKTHKIKLQIQNAESPIQTKTGQDGRILGISLKSYQIIKHGGK